MKLATYLESFILITLTASISYSETCFRNADEYAKTEKNLPKIFQNLPLMFTAENQSILFFDVSAAIKIEKSASGQLKLQGHIRKDDDLEIDESTISKACFDGSTMKITVLSGSSYNVEVDKQNVEIKGLRLQRAVSDRSYNTVISKLKQGIPGLTASSNTKGDSGTNQKGVQ